MKNIIIPNMNYVADNVAYEIQRRMDIRELIIWLIIMAAFAVGLCVTFYIMGRLDMRDKMELEYTERLIEEYNARNEKH